MNITSYLFSRPTQQLPTGSPMNPWCFAPFLAILILGFNTAVAQLASPATRADDLRTEVTPKADGSEYPGLTLYDLTHLTSAKAKVDEGVAPYTVAVDSLRARADRLLTMTPPSVMQKKMLPPSGNRHDYYSLGIYWWPDSSKEDGLPYIRKDGIRNPEYGDYDGPSIRAMANATFPLALAWFYTSDKVYATKAMELLATWFLNPETRMNPAPGVRTGHSGHYPGPRYRNY